VRRVSVGVTFPVPSEDPTSAVRRMGDVRMGDVRMDGGDPRRDDAGWTKKKRAIEGIRSRNSMVVVVRRCYG